MLSYLLDERLGIKAIDLEILQNVHELLGLVAMGRAKERLDTGRLGQPLGNAREEVEVIALNRYF